MADILLVDDQQNPRKAYSHLLKKAGYTVEEAEDGLQALNKLESRFFDLVITDMKMDNIDGIQVLVKTKKMYPNTEVIVMTAYGTIDDGVKAMKLGAYHYITKPFDNEEFIILVKRALEKRKTLEEVAYLKQELYDKYKLENVVGSSEPMKRIMRLVKQVAATESTVLITGESGTGKELIARAIHTNSLRRDKPMVTINCGALPENLLESELFGHIKGSFTGAIRDKKGLFQEADTGTIFLDEIGEISPPIQVRLLRCLQEKEIRRLGDTDIIKVDVRIIAATNKNLEEQVAKGLFREDLFYRLNVIPIHLPSLRDRKSDIPKLINHFLDKFSYKLEKGKPVVTSSGMSLLMNYHWPGNVRELENMVERIITLNNKKIIDADDISISYPQNYNNFMNFKDRNKNLTLAEMEEWLILDTLRSCSGNQKLTSQKLGISTTTLWRKIGRYNIDLAEIIK